MDFATIHSLHLLELLEKKETTRPVVNSFLGGAKWMSSTVSPSWNFLFNINDVGGLLEK